MILQRSFYQKDTLTVSRGLLGKILIHESSQGPTSGRIVETEAYLGPEDQAAHSAGGRYTARNEVMFGQKGHAYVYFIYGLYYCFNITTGSISRKPEAVLIRALEPVTGQNTMEKRRKLKKLKNAKPINLTNGPSKLCIAMDITKKQNKTDLTSPPLYIEDAPLVSEEDIMKTTRIGIDYAGTWKNKPWRFYIKDNSFVSTK